MSLNSFNQNEQDAYQSTNGDSEGHYTQSTPSSEKASFLEEIYSIDDVEALRRLLVEKERERQNMANDLDTAARLGLAISESNEEMQIKISLLEQENNFLSSELARSSDISSQLSFQPSSSPQILEQKSSYMTRELDSARKELKRYRKELDSLSSQLNDMATDMVESRSKVTTYAKKLAEVEHNLSATQEMNVNLQNLLEKALSTQKQSTANTGYLVKTIQSDLMKVVQENQQLRARVNELEAQQAQVEGQLSEMIEKAKEYADLLEQAQDTIHSLEEAKIGEMNGITYVRRESDEISDINKDFEHALDLEKEMSKKKNLPAEMKNRLVLANSGQTIQSDWHQGAVGLKALIADREETNRLTLAETPTLGSPYSFFVRTTNTNPISTMNTPTRFFRVLTSALDMAANGGKSS